MELLRKKKKKNQKFSSSKVILPNFEESSMLQFYHYNKEWRLLDSIEKHEFLWEEMNLVVVAFFLLHKYCYHFPLYYFHLYTTKLLDLEIFEQHEVDHVFESQGSLMKKKIVVVALERKFHFSKFQTKKKKKKKKKKKILQCCLE